MQILKVAPLSAAQVSFPFDAVAFAKANLPKATLLTELRIGRGNVDLAKDPRALERFKVGSFPGDRARGHQLTNDVFLVPRVGPDDRLRDHVIVRRQVVLPNDATGTRFYDCGVAPTEPPPRPILFP